MSIFEVDKKIFNAWKQSKEIGKQQLLDMGYSCRMSTPIQEIWVHKMSAVEIIFTKHSKECGVAIDNYGYTPNGEPWITDKLSNAIKVRQKELVSKWRN